MSGIRTHNVKLISDSRGLTNFDIGIVFRNEHGLHISNNENVHYSHYMYAIS